MSLNDQIASFLAAQRFAVAGASRRRHKYGNKVLRLYQQHQREVVPINPIAESIEGLTAYRTLSDVPEPVEAVSIITPPAVTERIVDEAIKLGVGHLWMQPGAESDAAIARAEEAGLNVIHGGPCILVVLGYREA